MIDYREVSGLRETLLYLKAVILAIWHCLNTNRGSGYLSNFTSPQNHRIQTRVHAMIHVRFD